MKIQKALYSIRHRSICYTQMQGQQQTKEGAEGGNIPETEAQLFTRIPYLQNIYYCDCVCIF